MLRAKPLECTYHNVCVRADVSGMDYYKGINESYANLMTSTNSDKEIRPNPLILMASIDCSAYAAMLCAEPIDVDGVSKHICEGVEMLVRGGVSFVVLASNTAHISVPMIRQMFPELPVLHIADPTASAIRAVGASCVGLLGTEPTMLHDYLKNQLAKHGVMVLVPDSKTESAQIFQYIVEELSCNIFNASTRHFFIEQIRALAARGAQGVILGCTEIELLVAQADVPEVPLFCSAQLHIEAATQIAAGRHTIDNYMPAEDLKAGFASKLRWQRQGRM